MVTITLDGPEWPWLASFVWDERAQTCSNKFKSRSDLTEVDWGLDVIRMKQIPESNRGDKANLCYVSPEASVISHSRGRRQEKA